MKEVFLKNITGFQHIGIPVFDLEESVGFYESLGFKTVMKSKINEENGIVYVAMMKLADIIVELYQQYAENAEEIIQRKDGHIDHIALNVNNIDEVFQVLKHNGFQIIESTPVFLNFWDNGCKYFTVRGPMNEKIEFNEICRSRNIKKNNL